MCIHCYEDGTDTERSGTVEELSRFGAVGVDIELQKERLIGCTGGCDVDKRIRCIVRDLGSSVLAQIYPLRALCQ